MKKLTEEQFIDRSQAILRARKIFIDSGVTDNLSVAFELYQGVLADQEREVFLSTVVYGNQPRTIMDGYERPLCPDCKSNMGFRPVPPNDEGVKIQLVCMNADCDTVLNSENDLEWWMNNLRKVDA